LEKNWFVVSWSLTFSNEEEATKTKTTTNRLVAHAVASDWRTVKAVAAGRG